MTDVQAGLDGRSRSVAVERAAGVGTGAVVLGVGCALLAARQWLAGGTARPTVALLAVFLVVGVVGVAWPVPATDGHRPPLAAGTVLAAGIAAFALGRLVGGGQAPIPFGAGAVVLNSLAAVAEEAFFRRFAYRVLSGWGPAGAIAGSAALFALVHLAMYGAWVLPIDLAAGLVLGWQRWAGGRWSVPALTHVVANVLVMV